MVPRWHGICPYCTTAIPKRSGVRGTVDCPGCHIRLVEERPWSSLLPIVGAAVLVTFAVMTVLAELPDLPAPLRLVPGAIPLLTGLAIRILGLPLRYRLYLPAKWSRCCQACGYDLRGSSGATCPECGAPHDRTGEYAHDPSDN